MAGLGRLALSALGVLAYKNRDKLAELLGGTRSQTSDPSNSREGEGIFDKVLRGGGLGDLLDRFRSAGDGDAVDSWVGAGPNQPIDGSNMEAAIDPEALDALVRQTGLTRTEIIDRLALNLPEVVYELTPDGQLPKGPELPPQA